MAILKLSKEIAHDLAVAYAGAAANNYMNDCSSKGENFLSEQVISNMIKDYFCAMNSLSSLEDEFIKELSGNCE